MPTRALRRQPKFLRGAAIALALPLLHCSEAPPESSATIESEIAVEVRSVTLDPSTNTPIVLLEEREGNRTLPIWIGAAEARSIALGLGSARWPRPNSHDLTKHLLDGLAATLERVVVTELRRGTYFAVLVVRAAGKSKLEDQRGETLEIDARPSDAIAIALRVDAPVYVREGLLEDAFERSTRERSGNEEVTL